MRIRLPIHFGPWRTLQKEDGTALSIRIGGEDVFFESDSHALTPHPHARACLAFVARTLGKRAVWRMPACTPAFADNLRAINLKWREWWGAPLVRMPSAPASMNARNSPPRKTALFFAAGVDSFFTLYENRDCIDILVHVVGFDREPPSPSVTAHRIASIQAVGAALGKEVCIVRTNLRERWPFSRINWERSHGAALAIVGWLLCGVADSFHISASFCQVRRDANQVKWGTHWETDSLWGSEGLSFHHTNSEVSRLMKLERIACHSLVRNHLSVCWEQRKPSPNCGICEKCARTRLLFRFAGFQEDVAAFEGAPPLEEIIAKLQVIPKGFLVIYQDFPLERLAPPLRREVEALVARSQ